MILNGKQLDRHCSLLRFHKLNMWGTTCLCVKQDCDIRKAVHGWTILAVTVTLSHLEQLMLCCCYRSIQESLNMACLYPFPCARSGSWISLLQRSPLSSFSFRASAVYLVCVWGSGWGGDVGGWCTPGVGEGGNKCNLESVDGSNTLGQSVSIKWKKVFCFGCQGLPTEIEINWKIQHKGKKTKKT